MKLGPALLLLVVACAAPQTPPPPIDRDGHGTELGSVCERLRAAGCIEGSRLTTGASCYEHLKSIDFVAIPTACLLAPETTTAEAVRKCGDRTELRFRCFSADGGS